MKSDLQKIFREWKTEATNEAAELFCYSDDVDTLLKGDACYVIGRKGSGKTAIAEHIASISEPQVFTERQSFDDFPFELLYQCTEAEEKLRNRFDAIWVQLIYMVICRMLTKNASVDESIKKRLNQQFPNYMAGKFQGESKEIDKISAGIKVAFKGLELGVDGSYQREAVAPDCWKDDVTVLENIIKDYAGDCTYYIIFDRLDDYYTKDVDKENLEQYYIPLVRGLFRAVQKIRNTSLKNYRIYPIVFLREDIYVRIKDNDKNKWDDIMVRLNWTEAKLKRMITHRLSVSLNQKFDNFESAWSQIVAKDARVYPFGGFRDPKTRKRRRRYINLETFIMKNSLMRPRDIIKFITICCKTAHECDRDQITREDVSRSLDAYSKWFKEEFGNEVLVEIPEIDWVWKILSDIRKQVFSRDEFVASFAKFSAQIVDKSSIELLNYLYNFSIVGNQDRANMNKFIHRYNSEVDFNENLSIVIHVGLLKSLQIS